MGSISKQFQAGVWPRVVASLAVCAICLASTLDVYGQLMKVGEAPSPMAALWGDQPHRQTDVGLALGEQLFVPNEGQWPDTTPHGRVALLFGREEGETFVPEGHPCAGTLLNLHSDIKEVFEAMTGATGSAAAKGEARRGACGGRMQLVDLTTCITSDVAMAE